MTAHKPVRIGVVGGGFGASLQWHLDPECEVLAVCDSGAPGLQRLRQTYRCDAGYPHFAEMLQHPGLNAVAIFTPAPMHAAMAIEAMESGKHVISAVPAGMTVEDLEALLDCVKRTGMKYMMAETSFYQPEIIRCRELARAGEFGTIFYSEAEYHHEGLTGLMYHADGARTWRYGYPPFLYPTHCTGMIVPVTGERLTEVIGIGWGDDHPMVKDNVYGNPFWNATAFFKTSGGHAARISMYWHVAAGGVERAQFLGDKLSYLMFRPEGISNTIVQIGEGGHTPLDENGYPTGDLTIRHDDTPDYFDRLPESMRVQTGHRNSHVFVTHAFLEAIARDRTPDVDIYEAIAYTLPGIIAYQSALKGGETLKIRDYGKATE